MTRWVTPGMPRPHRPQQSMLSGAGVAGAVLAAIVLTFTLASGIVAYSLTSGDPLTPSSNALVLDSHSGRLGARPLVLPRADVPAARGHASVPAAAASGNGGPGVAHGSLTPDRGRGGANPGARGPGDDATATGAGEDPVPVSGPARKPVGGALQGTTEAVGATTDSLARRLQAVTGALAASAQPLADDTRDALRAGVGAATGTLTRLLGGHPPR